MEYFDRLLELIGLEKEEDRKIFETLSHSLSVSERRENGMSWYPVAIREVEIGKGDYISVLIERTTHHELLHQFRFGVKAALFSNYDPKENRISGTVSRLSGNSLRLNLRVDELPQWSRDGKLGLDLLFDEFSYQEMEAALKNAAKSSDSKDQGKQIRLLTGEGEPAFDNYDSIDASPSLNAKQNEALKKIVSAQNIAIVHGPPGTGKTTTLIASIEALLKRTTEQLLVTAPSNAAVDLLTEKMIDRKIPVVRVGNPARVNEKQMSVTLDAMIMEHPMSKEIRRMKKQANEYRDLAQKYKRSFGPAEREQRKALFAEARKIRDEIENTENYIGAAVLDKARVITATLVGANHYSIRSRTFEVTVIDEAGQALEPACWIAILKSSKLVLAGDHQQLPPTIKSVAATRDLGNTLMEKLVQEYPESVVLLEEQYRMNHLIAGFSSKEFYFDKLSAPAQVASQVLYPEATPLLFIDTAGCGFEEVTEGKKMSNPEEGAFLIKQIEKECQTLDELIEAVAFPSIGIIAPYRHQVEILKEMVNDSAVLKDRNAYVTVNTVDSFQGQERDAIFISLTRSNMDNVIGFLSEIRRMNVAMTRARKKLVVVGDSATLSHYKFYADFISYCQLHNCYQSAWELME